jgi:hypothetical protein
MRRFPPLRPEVLALLAATMASPAWAGDPASAAKGAAQTEPAKPGAPQRFLGDKSSIAIQGGDLVIHDSSTLTMLRLHPIAAAVFLLADGQKPLAAIRSEAETSTGLPVDEATLFAVLDALADAKLLSARVTPPGSGDLSSFVLSDGTLGSALVEAGAAQPEAKLKLPEAKAKESAAKDIRRSLRLHESAQKNQTEFLGRAAKTTNMAREELKKVQERWRDREAKAKVVREAPGAQASDEAMIPVLKQRAEVLAKSESVLRKRSEQEVKQRYQTERLAGEDEATARKRQGATEAEYKVVRPLTKQ